MPNSPAFDWICQELEQRTDLDRLEARGTVRLTLKSAGLDAADVRPNQMRVVIEKVLPGELEARGIAGASALCVELAEMIDSIDADPGAETAEEIFRRLGGS